MSLTARLNQFLVNPTEGYRKSLFAGSTTALYELTGEPWFTWFDVPVMQQSPPVRFGLSLCRAPYASITLDEKKLLVPKRPEAKLFIQDCYKRFWMRALPRILDSYNCWGRGAAGIEYRFDPKRRILRIKKCRYLEPQDVEPHVFTSGAKRGQFAGAVLRSGFADRSNSFVGQKHIYYFAGFEKLGPFCDIPRIAGAASPWKEQIMPGGQRASRRLFYWTRAVGAVDIRYPHGERVVLPDGSEIDAQDAARMFGERLMNGVVTAIPNDVHPHMPDKYKWTVDMRPSQSDTAGTVEYGDKLNSEIWMGMEIPEEVAFANERGSGFSGRAVPMEGWLAQHDQIAGMIWDEFREQHVDRLMWLNYQVREYDAPLTSLLAEFREQAKNQGGDQGDGQQPGGGPPRPEHPFTGPRGGRYVVDDAGNRRPAPANLSALPEGGDHWEVYSQFPGIERAVNLSALHAPAGGITLQGKKYPGGEFIPPDVAAKVTPQERAKLTGGGSKKTTKSTTPTLTAKDTTATISHPADSPKPVVVPKSKWQTGAYCTPAEFAEVVKKCEAKAAEAPQPTADEVAFAESKVAELGANKYRRNLVGNTGDRAKRRDRLYAEFGDAEKKVCPCCYCGVIIGEGTLEQDKIVTTAAGGKYRVGNLVPACSDCNKRRGDMPFDAAMKKVKQYAGGRDDGKSTG